MTAITTFDGGVGPAWRVRWGIVVVACLLAAAFAVRPSAALASGNLNWRPGVEAVLPAGASSKQNVSIKSVSCASAHDCSAVGTYIDSAGNTQGLLLTESSGVWASGVEAVLPSDAGSTPKVSVSSVSCASAGNCTAVGVYNNAAGDQRGLLLTESSGVWQPGEEAGFAPILASSPTLSPSSVSCSSAGNCTAVGDDVDPVGNHRGLMVTQSSGVWGFALEPGLPTDQASNPKVSLTSVSCASAGNCIAVGDYIDTAGDQRGLILTESSGVWGGAEANLPADAGSNPNVSLTSVSCTSVGNCTAVGQYDDTAGNPQALLLTESSDVWAAGVKPALPGDADSTGAADLSSVSCASAGDCTAVGIYLDGKNNIQGLLLTESSGVWATGVEASLPNAGSLPNVSLSSVSCASAGNCAAIGTYVADDNGSNIRRGLLLTESSGVWATGVEPGLPDNARSVLVSFLNSVSCTFAGYCTATGDYIDSGDNQEGLLLSSAPANPTVSAGAQSSATPGDEIPASSISAALAGGSAATGTVTFTVFGPQSAPPASCASGGIAVGSASVSADGTYHPAAGFTPPGVGDYWWYASYGGDTSDNPSASACGTSMAETVVAAATTTTPTPTTPTPTTTTPTPTTTIPTATTPSQSVTTPSQPANSNAKPPRPVLSAVKLGARHFAATKGTTLKLRVSQAAKIKVRIGQPVTGHMVKGLCTRNARKGRRCTSTVTKRTLTYNAKAKGESSFKLRLRGTRAGSYTATVTAQNANGKSRAVDLKFTITPG